MAAASILPHSPRGTTEGLLSFDAAAVADAATPSFEGFAKDCESALLQTAPHVSYQHPVPLCSVRREFLLFPALTC